MDIKLKDNGKIMIEIKNKNYYDYILSTTNKYCFDVDIEPMFNINKFDFIKPIEKLYSYYKVQYYKNLYKKYRSYSFHTPVFINIYDVEIDEIMLQYVKCFKNLRVILVLENNKDKLGDIKNIHITKKLYLNLNQTRGVINQLYCINGNIHNINKIDDKMKQLNIHRNNNVVYCYFIEDIDISNKYIIGKTNNFVETIELSQILLNRESIKLLNHQRLDRFYKKDFKLSILKHMVFKKFLYKKFKLIDHIRILTVSASVLLMLGTTYADDIDIFIYHKPIKAKTGNLYKIIEKYLFDDKTKLLFVDTHIKTEKGWKSPEGFLEYQEDWFEKEWPSLFGASSLENVIFNPEFHFYYLGYKLVCLHGAIARRINRNRINSYTDLIALIIFNKVTINIPPMPRISWVKHEKLTLTDNDIDRIYEKIRNRFNMWHRVRLTIDFIKKHIPPPNDYKKSK